MPTISLVDNMYSVHFSRLIAFKNPFTSYLQGTLPPPHTHFSKFLNEGEGVGGERAVGKGREEGREGREKEIWKSGAISPSI